MIMIKITNRRTSPPPETIAFIGGLDPSAPPSVLEPLLQAVDPGMVCVRPKCPMTSVPADYCYAVFTSANRASEAREWLDGERVFAARLSVYVGFWGCVFVCVCVCVMLYVGFFMSHLC